MALGLVKLPLLEVQRRTLVEAIITKERDDEILREKTIFPSLHAMSPGCLPSLSKFCSASVVLKCPSLKKIDAVRCPKVELLAWSWRGTKKDFAKARLMLPLPLYLVERLQFQV
eukprot:XP_025013267.1 uncharacterized protein LOC112534968 [Ricinus communis]